MGPGKLAILIGAVIACCTFAGYSLLPNDVAPYVIMPGLFIGLFVAAILAAGMYGSAHGADWTVIGLLATIVNLPLYVGFAYAVLRVCFRNQEK